ncbi:MAG: DUF3568 family protein [Candidatus Omnitrophica bacterium]|nr:DUF3568 family protein [Candidatus Omnitrophota bacterium]
MGKRVGLILRIFLLPLLLIVNTGCIPLIIGTAVGAGGATYLQGSLGKEYNHPLSETHLAVLRALKNLKLFVKEDELNLNNAKVSFETETGKAGKVSLEALTEEHTKIVIRIGFFGDRDKSYMILNALDKEMR